MRLGILLDTEAGGNPVSVASVHDPDLLAVVAVAAIVEALRKAQTEADWRLRMIKRLEAEKLSRMLSGLIPELAETPLTIN